MNNLNNLLKRYFKLSNNNNFFKESIIKVLKTDLNLNIKSDQIIIKDNKIIITCSPLVKTELIINQKKILNSLQEIDPTFKIKSIS